jgi:hypothetical protein
MNPDDKLITIARYSTISDAYIYKNLLDMEGIESFVVDSNVSFDPTVASIHDGGVLLSVRQADAARALSALSQKRESV